MSRRFKVEFEVEVTDEEGLVERAQRRWDTVSGPRTLDVGRTEAALAVLMSASDLRALIEGYGEVDHIVCTEDKPRRLSVVPSTPTPGPSTVPPEMYEEWIRDHLPVFRHLEQASEDFARLTGRVGWPYLKME